MRKTKQTLKQQAKMERVVWGMLTVSLPFYGVVGYFMKDVEGSTTVVYGMAAAAVVTLMMGFLIKDLLLKKRFSGETPGTTARPGGSGNHLVSMLIVWGLTESAGVFGLVARIMGADQKTLMAFIGLALIAMWIHRPLARKDDPA